MVQKASWNEIAELIGIVAIVASLVFVGLQMKQSQDIAIGAQYHERAALTIDNLNAELESGRLLPFFARLAGYDAVSDGDLEEFAALGIWQTKFLLIMDNNYFQYQSGFMEESAWQAYREFLKRVLGQNSRLRGRVQSPSTLTYRQPFTDLCNELITEYESDAGED